MGLMDKLKAAKNAVTGGAANVTLEIGQAARGEVATMKITATAKANLNAKKVYIIVRAVEEAVVEDYDTGRGRETVRGEHVSHEMTVDVAGQTEMTEGQTQSWDAQVQLPAGAGSSYHGRIIRHVWKAQAGLDTVGNDPDSGWIEFTVN
jgi:hypothetical protein